MEGVIFTEILNNTESKNNSAVKIGNALIGNDFYLKMADESVYHFFGEFDIFPITKNIHFEYVDKFVEKVKSLPVGKKDFMLLKLRHASNSPYITDFDRNQTTSDSQYISVIIFMEKGYASAKNYDFTNIEIYHILYLYECAKNYNEAINKYDSILSLSDDIYFEYSSKSKKITLFQFKDGKEHILYKGSLDGFAKKLDLPKDTYDSGFNKLIYDIENFSSGFFHIIESNLFSEKNDYEKISVKGISVNNLSQTDKDVIGVMKNSRLISQSDIDFLESKSNIDSLTGLLNKKAITDAIHLKMKSESIKTLSLIMMDIDYFKDINDNYGHMFGDEVLTTVAETLKNVVGERGIVGRIGGDEFLIAIENLNTQTENELRSILRSIRSKIEWSYSGKIKITTSLGSSSWPKDADSYETLLKLADKCLYIAKEKGRNRFIIYTKEKHGTLSSVDLSSKAISMMPKVSITKKSKHICDLIELLSHTKHTEQSLFSTIKKAADSLKDYYLYDNCMIFYGDNFETIYSNATKKDEKVISILDSYKDLFDERDMLIIGNYISTEMKNINLYNYLRETANFSIIQYLIKDDEKIKGLISISTCHHSNKWSEVDINYLAIIFKLISKLLLQKK